MISALSRSKPVFLLTIPLRRRSSGSVDFSYRPVVEWCCDSPLISLRDFDGEMLILCLLSIRRHSCLARQGSSNYLAQQEGGWRCLEIENEIFVGQVISTIIWLRGNLCSEINTNKGWTRYLVFLLNGHWSGKEIQWVSVNWSLFGKLEEIRAARKVNRTFGRELKKRLGIDWERHWLFQESQCS